MKLKTCLQQTVQVSAIYCSRGAKSDRVFKNDARNCWVSLRVINWRNDNGEMVNKLGRREPTGL